MDVRVDAMRLTMIARLVSGLPRQFAVMCENSLCSILFHLLVPGGKGILWWRWGRSAGHERLRLLRHLAKRLSSRSEIRARFPRVSAT